MDLFIHLKCHIEVIVISEQRQAKIRMVLVNTAHPGNIGGAARAIKNMGLSELYLVEQGSFLHLEPYGGLQARVKF